MRYNLKKIIALLLVICLLSSQRGANALDTALPSVDSPQPNSTSALLPTFRYHRYNIEPYTKSYVDLLVPPDAKLVRAEVIEAEEIGGGLGNEKLRKEGLKIIKHQRKRSDISKRESLEEEKFSANKATFNLQKLTNKQQITEMLDYKIFKIALKGLPSSSYTLRAIVDDKYTTTTKIYTKPDFRIDDVSPEIIDIGIESTLTIDGKNLDLLTKVDISGDDIEIREIESTNDGILKVKAFVQESAEIGFRDVTVTSPLLGKSATLVNGLYVGPRIGKDGVDGKDGIDGIDGHDGLDGMGICNNPTDSLMLFTNTLTPGSQASVHFDSVLCNLTLGIPVGYNGSNGSNGISGKDGTNVCTNRNATLAISSVNLPPGSETTSSFDPNACTLVVGVPQGATGTQGIKGDKGDTGATGATGLAGINCWDLNGNRINDPSEDVNKDGVFDTLDCQKKDKDK